MIAEHIQPLRIAIIGAGFSGTALAATLSRYAAHPFKIILIDKRSVFGLGEAYSTPYPYHLLNVRAQDMSAFEEEPNHFVDWLQTVDYPEQQLDQDLPLPRRFAPRMLYGKYLQALLSNIPNLTCMANEVVDIVPTQQGAQLNMQNGESIFADKVILALGNGMPNAFPFPVSNNIRCINNSWDFASLASIPQQDPVLIVGTGLSMIDAVLTLHHQRHQGNIYALSRHGLLPLPHTEQALPTYDIQTTNQQQCRALTKYVRRQTQTWMQTGGDWRAIIQSLRVHIPAIWSQATVEERKRFLRHVLPFWNIHRHRVHHKLAALLAEKSQQAQLKIMAGRILEVRDSVAKIRLRHRNETISRNISWLINCMGPSPRLIDQKQPLINALQQRGLASFDALNLGFSITSSGAVIENSGQASAFLFALGPPTKGMLWETSAVPEIRKQCLTLAKHLAGLV